MSCNCSVTFLREPFQLDLEAMGNVLLTLSIDLWANQQKTEPFDLTGYTARAGLRTKNGGTVVSPALTAVITQTAELCNITATYSKTNVEALSTTEPYIYDISVDNSGTGDSFCVWTGIISFQLGATS